MEQPGITAVILAAGYSGRMERFKPLLDLGGLPVIERVIASFKCAGIPDVRVVAGYRREILIPVLERLGAKVIINDRYAEGMFSSVQAAVKSLGPTTGAFFLMPADVPLVRAETIRYLAQSYNRHRGKILVPVFGGRRGHPPLIAGRFAGAIMNYKGESGLGGILSLHDADIIRVPVADGNILLDMDTPGDYADVQSRVKSMDVPTAAECQVILKDIHAAPDAVIDHGKAVAEVALLIVDEMNRHGFSIDRELMLSAALLHDLAKGRPAHALESARMVCEMGYAGVAALIETHMDIVPGTGENVRAAEVLYLADKLVSGDKVVTLPERIEQAMDRYGDKPEIAGRIRIRHENAVSILARIEETTGALNFSRRMMAGAPL
jgi:molybdenum cofactor cytidylyltransferase